MKYNELFNIYVVITLILSIIYIIYKSKLNIIFSIEIHNSDVLINLNIRYLFSLLNINKQIYPPKNIKNKKKKTTRKKEKEKIKKKKFKILKNDIISIYILVKHIKLKEFYSNIRFGSENIYFTSFIYVFINSIYGILINIVQPQKLYLNCSPCFTENYAKINIKIHITPNIKELIKIGIILLKIYKKNKDGVNNESNRFNTKSYGDNS